MNRLKQIKIDNTQAKQILGYKKTITDLVKERSSLKKELHRLRRELGILEEGGFIESKSLPLIIIGAGYRARPICEVHGAMLRYKNDIWRCEGCKTAVDLSQSLKWIREEYDGVVVIK